LPWNRHVLVVANVTAGSQELLSALRTRAESGPTTIHLVVPATPFGGGRAGAMQKLQKALAEIRAIGVQANGSVGPPDPLAATIDAWDPRQFDEIIVSTLPIGSSRWMRAGLPARIEQFTGAPVTHVVSRPAEQGARGGSAPVRRDRTLMGPLSVLTWGSVPDQRRPGAHGPTASARHAGLSA